MQLKGLESMVNEKRLKELDPLAWRWQEGDLITVWTSLIKEYTDTLFLEVCTDKMITFSLLP